MEKSLLGAHTPGPATQRRILHVAREAARFLADPSLIAERPIEYARAEAALEAIFETSPRSAILSNYVRHNLNRQALKILEARYAEWERGRAAS